MKKMVINIFMFTILFSINITNVAAKNGLLESIYKQMETKLEEVNSENDDYKTSIELTEDDKIIIKYDKGTYKPTESYITTITLENGAIDWVGGEDFEIIESESSEVKNLTGSWFKKLVDIINDINGHFDTYISEDYSSDYCHNDEGICVEYATGMYNGTGYYYFPYSHAKIQVIFTCQILSNQHYDDLGNKTSHNEYNAKCGNLSCNVIHDTYFNNEGLIIDKETYDNECKKYSCQEVEDEYYDPDGNKVSEKEYNIKCKKYSCEKVDDEYYDSEGNKISEEEYNTKCKKYSCQKVEDEYYDFEGNKVSEKEYNINCKKYSCQKVDNEYFDKNGNKVGKEEYNKLCPSDNPNTGTYFPLYLVLILLAGSLILLITAKKNDKFAKINK